MKRTVPRIFGSFFVVAGIAAAALVSAAPTYAYSWASYPIDNYATKRCIDDSFAFGLRTLPCYGNSYQQWHWDGIGGANTYFLVNANTGRCIDDSFSYGLRSLTCNSLDYQTWQYDYAGEGEFRNVATGRCIDDSYAFGLRTLPCYGNDYQHWAWYPI